MTMEQIMDLVNVSPRDYKQVDKIKSLNPVSTSTTKGTNYDQEIANMFGSTDFSTRDDGTKQYKVWIMQEPEKYSIIVNETLTIRESDNPNGDGKIGAFLMKDIPVPHQLYAWGEPDPIKKIEDSMSDQANMRNDAVFYDLLKMWQVNPEGLVDGEEFIPQPGTVVQVKQPGAIAPLDTGVTKATAYKEYSEWEQIIQGISGATDYATGQNAQGMNKTLGGIELLQQAANARFALKLQLFEQLGLKAMGSMYVQRNMRFFDTAQTVPTEKGKTQILPDQIRRLRGNIHFIVDTGSTEAVNQSTEQTKWTTIINMIGKPPFDHLSQAGLEEIARNMLFALRVPNVDEIMAQPQDQNGQGQGAAGNAQGTGFTQQQLQTMVQLVQQLMQKVQTDAATKAKESLSLNYKDVPDSIKRQMEAAAGFTPADGATTPTQPGQSTTPTQPDQTQQPAAPSAAAQPTSAIMPAGQAGAITQGVATTANNITPPPPTAPQPQVTG